MTVSNHSRPLATGDFVELSYTARTAEDGRVVDTTDADVATDADIADLTATGPTVVVLGAGHLFEPVEAAIQEVGVGGSGTVTVPADEAFGDVDPTAKRTVDTDRLPEDRRSAGARVRLAGETGFVESIDEESATLNFNHPLAGSAIEYEFTVHRRIDDRREQFGGILAMYELADRVDVSLDDTSSDCIARLSVEGPLETIDEWERRKQGVVEDVLTWLDIDQFLIEESYAP